MQAERIAWIVDTHCGFVPTCTALYMIIGMDYHNEQVPLHCRVCEAEAKEIKGKEKNQLCLQNIFS